MPPIRDAPAVHTMSGEARVQSLLGVMDLVGRDTRLDEFLPHLALCLRTIVDFDLLSVVVPRDEWKTAQLYAVRLASSDAAPTAADIQSIAVEPLDKEHLAAASEDRHEAIVLDRLDDGGEYWEVIAVLRGLGQQSACLLPLATALGPAGLIAFASTREATYGQCDISFLQHIATQVAVGIDNVRHQQEAIAREGQLQAEREHLRALLELTNAVTTRDVESLAAAIAPNLQRVVGHDDVGLFLLHPASQQMGRYGLTARGVGWTDELTEQIRPDKEPLATWLAERRAVDMDLERFDWTGREGIRSNITAAGLKRTCFVPLATPRGTLGFLFLNRRSGVPFSPDDLDRGSQAAAQIAIALENALAFDEIATLKDRLAHENIYLKQEIRNAKHLGEIVAESAALKRILHQVTTVAPTDSTVLLLGETGTGKELIARAVHAASERRARTLVTVNCATSPAGLLESEWFGHEKGAFTGALAQKVGRFELAHQGTLFLDEIGDVPLELQSKLLRALQEREIERLGSTRTIRVDFRLIAATNRNLEEMAAKREFRSDLYYRLNVFPIRVPPLRERREDIPPLVHYFVQRFAKRLRRPIESVSRESMEMLCRWPWPGNVRELQNVIERAVIVSTGPTLTVPRAEFDAVTPTSPVTLKDVEREHIVRILEQTGWVIGGPQGAAAHLGIKRTSLVSTMRRLGIVRPTPHTRRPDVPSR